MSVESNDNRHNTMSVLGKEKSSTDGTVVNLAGIVTLTLSCQS